MAALFKWCHFSEELNLRDGTEAARAVNNGHCAVDEVTVGMLSEHKPTFSAAELLTSG